MGRKATAISYFWKEKEYASKSKAFEERRQIIYELDGVTVTNGINV